MRRQCNVFIIQIRNYGGVRMRLRRIMSMTVLLIIPLILFAILLTPYDRWNRNYLVHRYGCGCNFDSFNANDFTKLFWLFVSVCATVWSVFMSKLIPKNRKWLRVAYVLLMWQVCLMISYHYSHMLKWL